MARTPKAETDVCCFKPLNGVLKMTERMRFKDVSGSILRQVNSIASREAMNLGYCDVQSMTAVPIRLCENVWRQVAMRDDLAED